MSALRNVLPIVSPQAQPAGDLPQLARELAGRIAGEVRFDDGSRALYATDASNYRQTPIGVVIPRTIEDVVETISLCRRHGVPILSRGGGTSLAGQCCNVAVVMDWSKYLNRVLEVDPEARMARVQPGAVLDNLRQEAEKYHLTFGPDPATHNRCTIGGMLGNNSCGIHAQMAGKTVDNTEELEILTYDGVRVRVGWMSEAELDAATQQGGRRGEIFSEIRRLRDRYANVIRERYPRIPRRVSGYNLDQLLPDKDGRFNLARALVGSEGTLVTILEAKLRLVHSPPKRSLVVVGYPDVYQAVDHVPEILQFEPIGFEGIDNLLVENMKTKGLHVKDLSLLPEGQGWLLVEFGGDTQEEADANGQRLIEALGRGASPPKTKLYTDAEEQSHVWETRESGLGATAFVPGEPTTWPGWEDSAVAPDKLGGYLRDLCKLYEKYDYKGALYGHFGMGCVHTRVSFDLASAPGISKFRSFLEEASTLVVRYGGSLSGEHGDGQARAEFLGKMFGPEILKAFGEFKGIWDPEGRMNPGKVVDPHNIDQNLRLGANYSPWQPKTHFRFPDDQGRFVEATTRCVGVGLCRREKGDPGKDTMCPSYMVTREEKHATRGRAHLLWEMLQGDVIRNGWRDEAVKDSLDLCLSCKGCKGDCPVNVDLATYKAEFLSHYWEGRLRPRHAYAFGLIDQWARAASLWPGAVNLVTQTPGLSTIAKLAAGMPLQRRIPEFAPQSFQRWFGKRRTPREEASSKVILWPDTFNNYFFPETAQAATAVLEDAGFEVSVPQGHVCCGRPLYDYGMLDQAKKYLRAVLRRLQPHLQAGIPVVVLEPSCASVFRDELHGLFPDDPLASKLREHTFLLSEFLEQKASGYQLPEFARKALVQGHCHHKSILKFDPEEAVLRKMHVDAEVPPTGCCGMAGSFGFEKQKYEVSIAVGEHVLLPAVRRAPLSTVVIADGFSCREQIMQQTGREALHLAEVIQIAKDDGRAAPLMYPESKVAMARSATRRRARRRAAGILAGIVATGFAVAGLAVATGRKR